jgi:hypothetical protein
LCKQILFMVKRTFYSASSLCLHTITFRGTDRAKRAYVSLKWENGESDGSEIQSEAIP